MQKSMCPYSEEVTRVIVHALGNDLGETLYLIYLKHNRYIQKAIEFEVSVPPSGELSYVQELMDGPFAPKQTGRERR